MLQNINDIISYLPVAPGYVEESEYKLIITYAPAEVIMCLGIWAATQVIYGVYLCKNCPNAAEELDLHVKVAKKELLKRGINVE